MMFRGGASFQLLSVRLVAGRLAQRIVDSVCDDGCHVGLKVHLETLVRGAVKVDGKRRDAKDGPRDFDQLVRHLPTLATNQNPPRDAEVAVEPGMPQATPVVLHSHLEKPGVRRHGVGLELRARRVGVRADDDEAAAGGVLRADRESGDGRHVPREEVLAPGLDLPSVALRDLLNVLACAPWRV